MKIEDIIHKLNKEIKYCHFKSNEHLSASFNGETDFDFLIHKNDIYKFQKLVIDLGFKRRVSTVDKQYFGMEDYICFDSENGKLYHFHVHYQLIFGKKYSKNYVLDMNNILWSNLKMDKEYNIPIPIPEIELILLILRIGLKTGTNLKTVAKIMLGRNILPKNLLDEFNYLDKQIDETKFTEITKHFNIEYKYFYQIFRALKNNQTNKIYFLYSKNKLTKSLSEYKILSKKQNIQTKKLRKCAKINSGSWLNTIGTTIAFVGCDGAGKSTIVNEINKWLSWKISVKQIYMGRPKKYPNRIKIFAKINNTLKYLGYKGLINVLEEQRFLYHANERRMNYFNSLKFKQSGKIVIFDRYPLKEFWSMNEPMDGPRILSNSNNSNKEKNIYSAIKEPDLLFLLNVEIEESLRRKKTQGIKEDRIIIERKYNAIQKVIMQKSNQDNVCVIDAMRPYNEVLLEIKRKIWKTI